jgi:hypothetical protein
MTAAAPQLPALDSRRRHQAQVAALLDAIDERRRRLYLLQAYGVTPAAAADLKEELRSIRRKLAAAVGTGA